MAKELWEGNNAIAEAAVRAGLEAYFGYPITPQTELLEYLSRRMPELGRAFVQAESELGAINMVYGAAAAGARAMTSSSSPGYSLMQEGLSYIAGGEVPAVIVDVMRGGPGLGNLAPTQADYFQLTKGGGHGDFHPIVLAPATVQEAVDLTYCAFDLAEKYRCIVIIAADGNVGQIMEPVELPPMRKIEKKDHGWELTGAAGRKPRGISSLYLEPSDLSAMNDRLRAKEKLVCENEVRYEARWNEDADLIVVAFGTAARLAQSAVKEARSKGLRVGLFRPISLYPFPKRALAQVAEHAEHFLVVEMNAGQMVDDVRLAIGSRPVVEFFGRTGGQVPMPDEVLAQIERIGKTLPPHADWNEWPDALFIGDGEDKQIARRNPC
jgi:2-oxoglutarate/2-oxoacid ferredoxin oxidoreductase subunit alpha